MKISTLAMMTVLGAALTGCCGDSDAVLQVHVVDGETGVPLLSPIVLVDGDQMYCESDVGFLDAPVPTDDGGLALPDDGGIIVTPPPGHVLDMAGLQSRGCDTYVWSLSAGFHTVEITAAGYYSSSQEVSMGDGGSSFTCPEAIAVETTIALYKKN